jgi:hypothetical protein
MDDMAAGQTVRRFEARGEVETRGGGTGGSEAAERQSHTERGTENTNDRLEGQTPSMQKSAMR